MALKATIHKVRLQLADMDRNIYGDHELTIARHPSETDERRLSKASSRSEAVTVYSYAASTPIWWAALAGKLVRAPKVVVWQIEPEAVEALARLVERSMSWQVSVQDGTVWVSDAAHSVEITPRLLKAQGV